MSDTSRRELLGVAGAATLIHAMAPGAVQAAAKLPLIATEEAFATPEFLKAFLDFAASSTNRGVRYAAELLARPALQSKLTDMEVRLAEMDANGVDWHLASLVSPGVQVFDADQGSALASQVNDALAAHIRRHPGRLCGLAAIAPQDPERAAGEIGRAMTELGLNGIIINSHTHGEFLDDPKYAPIFAAAVRYKAPIYLHPTFPPDEMIKPFEHYNMTGAIWGFGAETSLHAVRMILGGVFDRHPDLQVVLGHMGEALPYWFFRLDLMYRKLLARADQAPGMVRLARAPSEYVRSNFHFTTSGCTGTS